MIFHSRSMRAIFHAFINRKPCFDSFPIRKNVRFLCTLQKENVWPKSTGFVDTESNPEKLLAETLYFKNMMENNPKYPDITFREDILKANENSVNKLVVFLRNAINSVRSDKSKSANNFLTSFWNSSNKISEKKKLEFEISNLKNFEDDIYSVYDMIEIFHLLPIYCELLSKPLNSELMKLGSLMENKCRVLEKSSIDIGLIITLLRLMRNINAPQSVSFPLLFYLYYRYKKLTTVQLLEYFYILIYNKLIHSQETKFGFESFVVNAISEMNNDEVALLSFACFRSRLQPGSHLAEAVSNRTLEEVENLNDLQAATMFKFLQFSGRRRISENLSKTFEKLIPIIDKFTITTAIHIVCSGVSVNTESKELFLLVWNRAIEEFHTLRLKDIERLLLTSLYTNFRVTEDSQFIKLIRQRFTNENEEMRKYPRPFFSLLNFLIMHNIYIEDLITYAMSDKCREKVEKKFGKLKFVELLFIDGSVELERPEYKTKPLSTKQRKEIALKTQAAPDVITSSTRYNYLIFKLLKKIYGEESVVLINPVIHYATIHPILCINRNNEPQVIGDRLGNRKFSTLPAPKDGNLWIAFVLLRWQACLSDKITPNLVTEAKLRHFRKAGYIPITVCTSQLSPLAKDEVEEFLSKSIKDTIRSLNN